MKTARRVVFVVSSLALLNLNSALAQDWPEWRGPNRDARATGFKAPKTWPKELTQKWKVAVGDGVATPSLVGDKLYVFSRQDGAEIIRCMDAATGKELWQDKYDVLPATGPAQGFSGPRCSPTVAGGKVVTLGLRGTLSCYDAANGKLLWRKEDFKGSLPRFFTSSSPIITDRLCIAQLGGGENGGVIAYDLTTGDEKWKWTGDAAAYASPSLLTVAGTKMVVAETEKKIVILAVSDGKLLWETPFAVPGRGYNAACPVVNGQMIIYTGSGRGATAVKIEKEGDAFVAKELWKNPDNSVQFNTPVVKTEAIYGLTANNEFFCLNLQDGKTAWTAPLTPPAPATEGQNTNSTVGAQSSAATQTTNAQAGVGAQSSTNTQAAAGGQGGRGGRGGRGGGRGGYASIVDAGSVLLALTPASELVVFEPSAKAYTEVARIKVSDTPTYTYPVVSGNRIFIKDQDNVILYTVQ